MEMYFKVSHYLLKKWQIVFFEIPSFSFQHHTCLLGESGSGKSLFLNDFCNRACYDTNGKVEFCFFPKKEVIHWQEELSWNQLDSSFQEFCLSFFQNQQKISEKCALVKKMLNLPHYLFCEDFHFHSQELELLLHFCTQKNILFFYVTHDIESTYLFDYLMVLKNNCVAIEGATMSVLKEEKIMKKLGYSLPFYVNLSIQLQYYNLLEEIVTNKNELEEKLWHGK